MEVRFIILSSDFDIIFCVMTNTSLFFRLILLLFNPLFIIFGILSPDFISGIPEIGINVSLFIFNH